ncbi:hypothetical protein OR221_3217 [Microbacterium laevaniformans OR221]|nr:hypothetical protein OR221_3217 [Microbacterium laevaniformans OR221]
MQVTLRDERIFEWMRVVRIADSEALRWVLAATDGRSEPVSARRAQQWIARGVEAGVIERARPIFRDGSVVWLSHAMSGRPAPNLFRATTRHEVAVAALSARFLAAGYSWERDSQPRSTREHAADGIARLGERVERVEVELTAKALPRYQLILSGHGRWLTEGVERVVYVGTPTAMRAVAREADKWVHPAVRDRLVTLPVLDERGHVVESLDALWSSTDQLEQLTRTGQRLEDEPAVSAPVLPAPTLPVWGGRD